MIADTTVQRDARVDAPPGMFTEALRMEARSRPANLRVQTFRDPSTGASSHLVYDEPSRIGVVIDPFATGEGSDAPHADLVEAIDRLAIDLQFALETRARDGHRSASGWLARRHGSLVVRGAGDAPTADEADPRTGPTPFDILARDGDEIVAGPLRIQVISKGPGTTHYRIAGSTFPAVASSPGMARKLATRRLEASGTVDPDPAAAA